jgi:hypothetical protein
MTMDSQAVVGIMNVLRAVFEGAGRGSARFHFES